MIWLFTLYVFFMAYRLLVDIPRLMWLNEFYLQLLEIPDSDMQSISWQEVVTRIMALREANPVTAAMPATNRKYIDQNKQRLEALDISNRILRKDNYLIALYNKEILDLTLPIPFLRDRQVFSRALQWNIDWCILNLVFNESGQIRQLVLKDSKRRELSDALRSRFLFAGFMNAIFAPVIIMYLLIVYFFKYFSVCHVLSEPVTLANTRIGVPEKPFGSGGATVYPIGRMEVQRVQRAEPSFSRANVTIISLCNKVSRTVPKSQNSLICKVFNFYIWRRGVSSCGRHSVGSRAIPRI